MQLDFFASANNNMVLLRQHNSCAAMPSTLIAGVDEAGRGPLVGAVVAAAVILPQVHNIIGLADSKVLSASVRERLFTQICQQAVCVAAAMASPAEIDQLNILQASLLAMQRAVLALQTVPTMVWVDGNKLPQLPMPAQCWVKGDALHANISAASIVAKVLRDRQMHTLDVAYPQYGFAKHKGYPTAQHLQALAKYGVLPDYRKSFAPVKQLLL